MWEQVKGFLGKVRMFQGYKFEEESFDAAFLIIKTS